MGVWRYAIRGGALHAVMVVATEHERPRLVLPVSEVWPLTLKEVAQLYNGIHAASSYGSYAMEEGLYVDAASPQLLSTLSDLLPAAAAQDDSTVPQLRGNLETTEVSKLDDAVIRAADCDADGSSSSSSVVAAAANVGGGPAGSNGSGGELRAMRGAGQTRQVTVSSEATNAVERSGAGTMNTIESVAMPPLGRFIKLGEWYKTPSDTKQAVAALRSAAAGPTALLAVGPPDEPGLYVDLRHPAVRQLMVAAPEDISASEVEVAVQSAVVEVPAPDADAPRGKLGRFLPLDKLWIGHFLLLDGLVRDCQLQRVPETPGVYFDCSNPLFLDLRSTLARQAKHYKFQYGRYSLAIMRAAAVHAVTVVGSEHERPRLVLPISKVWPGRPQTLEKGIAQLERGLIGASYGSYPTEEGLYVDMASPQLLGTLMDVMAAARDCCSRNHSRDNFEKTGASKLDDAVVDSIIRVADNRSDGSGARSSV